MGNSMKVQRKMDFVTFTLLSIVNFNHKSKAKHITAIARKTIPNRKGAWWIGLEFCVCFSVKVCNVI